MEIRNSQKSSTVSGLTGDGSFTANIDGIAFQTLIGTLYKDKPRAVARETIANCRDANIWRDQMYGTITREKLLSGNLTPQETEIYSKLKAQGYADPQTPYEIHIPTPVEPWLEFADYGIGLTLEQAIGKVSPEASEKAGHPVRQGGYFNTMFNSSKRDENVSIGGFGLGFKCPLSIVDSFSCRIIKEGFEHQFIIFFSKDGIPDINWLTRTDDYTPAPIETDRENGVVVRLDTLQQSLFNRLRTAISDILQTFPKNEQPIINEGEYIFKSMETEFITDTAYIVKNYHYGNLFENNFLVECGGVLYPMDDYKLSELFDSEKTKYIKAGFNQSLVVKMPLGTVRVPPSREEISYDDMTVKNIEKELDKIYEILVERNNLILENIDFKNEDDVNKAFKQLERFYESKGNLLIRFQEILTEKLKSDPEFKNWSITLKMTSSTFAPLSLHYTYLLEELTQFDAGHISDYDRLNSENRVMKSFSKNPSNIISTGRLKDNLVDDNAYNALMDYITQDNILIRLDGDEDDIVKVAGKITRNYSKIKNLIEDKFFKKLVTAINNQDRLIIFEVNKENDKLQDERNFKKLLNKGLLVGLGNCTQHGAPLKMYLNRFSKIENKEPLSDESVEIIEKALTKAHTLMGKKLRIVNASYIYEMVDKYVKLFNKNKPKAPKVDEMERNVSLLHFSYYSGAVTPSLRDISRSSTFGSCKPTMDENPIEHSEDLTKFFNGDEGYTSTVYWTTEQHFEEFLKSFKENSLVSPREFENYKEKFLNGSSIFVVKGSRTISRRSFDSASNAIEIDLNDLIFDIRQTSKVELSNKDSYLYETIPYDTIKRIGLPAIKFYSVFVGMVVETYNIVALRKVLLSLSKHEDTNPYFKQYLQDNDIDLRNILHTMNTYIDIDNQLIKDTNVKKKVTPSYGNRIKLSNNIEISSKLRSLLGNNGDLGLKAHRLSKYRKNERSYLISRDLMGLKNLVRMVDTHLDIPFWKDDIKAIYDLIRMFSVGCGIYVGSNILDLTEDDMKFVEGIEVDKSKMFKDIERVLAKNMPVIKHKIADSTKNRLEDSIENLINNYVRGAKKEVSEFVQLKTGESYRNLLLTNGKIDNLSSRNSPNIRTIIGEHYEIIDYM